LNILELPWHLLAYFVSCYLANTLQVPAKTHTISLQISIS